MKNLKRRKKKIMDTTSEGKIPVLGTNAMGTIYIHSTRENLNINELKLQMTEMREEIRKMIIDVMTTKNIIDELKPSLPKK
jgi:23S rRNA maturation-related 3'-5' exoribonuclease YhaM